MKQINKVTARKLWNEGKEFWMTPCNMRPACGILIQSIHHDEYASFDTLYNIFSYFNCDNERGWYPRFYVDD